MPRHETIEMVGPAGRIKVPAALKAQYAGRGYQVCQDAPGKAARPLHRPQRASEGSQGAREEPREADGPSPAREGA